MAITLSEEERVRLIELIEWTIDWLHKHGDEPDGVLESVVEKLR